MKSRIKEEIQPVEEAKPTKIKKAKTRRKKKTQVDEEMIRLENLAFDKLEMNDNFKKISELKIQVFFLFFSQTKIEISAWTANASELCEEPATKSFFSPKKFSPPAAFIRKRRI